MKTVSVYMLMICCVVGTQLPVRAQEKVPTVITAVINRGSRIDRNSPEYIKAHEKETQQGVMVNRADVLVRTGYIAEAKKLYAQVLTEAKGEPVSSEATRGLGEIARINGDYQTALSYYDDYMTTKPGQYWMSGGLGNYNARMKYALLLQRAGRYDEAWKHYQFVMNTHGGWSLPKPPAVTREQVPTAQFVFGANLVVAATILGHDDAQGASFARDAAKANPSSGLPHYYLGQLLWRKDLAGAKAAYEKAVRIGRGEYVKDAERELFYVKSQLAKPVAPTSADTPKP